MCTLRCLTMVATAAIAFARTAPAQCLEWDTRFHARGANSTVNATAVFDDGSGPALFIGGSFGAVADESAAGVARWNGSTWSALAGGVTGEVRAMSVFDDGSGPALYVGGTFVTAGGVPASRIARWDGTNWSALGSGVGGAAGAAVHALAVWNDGRGPALYAGGSFTSAGGMSASYIARWDGENWTTLGTGFGDTGVVVRTLVGFDDGTGGALYAGGTFGTADGMTARGIARWNGTTWSGVGGGIGAGGGAVYSLAIYDDGLGAALYMGGTFGLAGDTSALCIAKWNTSSWSAVGGGMSGHFPTTNVQALAVHDDGSGSKLYAGGYFTTAGGISAPNLAKWDGSNWSELGSGTSDRVLTIAAWDDGSGEALYTGGQFELANGVRTVRIAKWDGTDASAVGGGDGLSGSGSDPSPKALTVFDDGTGPALYAGGGFVAAGDAAANGVAKWDGEHWTAVSSGVDDRVLALTVFDDGGGQALYAGGYFTFAGGVSVSNIAKWDGSSWSALGSGIGTGLVSVEALAVFDDGSGQALYAGGYFTSAGGVSANYIAKWNGSSWSPVASGTNAVIFALAVFDDGSGPALYAGGAFSTAGGVSASNIAKWDGSSWSPLASGADETVCALTVFDDGSGPALLAAGYFRTAGGMSVNLVAKWDGTTWSALAGGLPQWHVARASIAFDDGTGEALFVGGDLDGASDPSVAKWDGTTWHDLGLGPQPGTWGEDGVTAFASFGAGTSAPDLFVGGDFTLVGGRPSEYIVAWLVCGDHGAAYCFGDGVDSLVTAQCPCGNFGAPGHGCANSNASLGGAVLTASGGTNPNTLVFTCSGIPNNNLCTFLRGAGSDDAGVVFGDGIRCVASPVFRFGQQIAGQDGNPANTVRAPAGTVALGNTRYYQCHYRNPGPGFCPVGTFNISNGYSIHW